MAVQPIQAVGRYVPSAEIVSEGVFVPPPPTPTVEGQTRLVSYRIVEIRRMDTGQIVAQMLNQVAYAWWGGRWPRRFGNDGGLPFTADEQTFIYPVLAATPNTTCASVVAHMEAPKGANPEARCVVIPPLPPGLYRIRWQLQAETVYPTTPTRRVFWPDYGYEPEFWFYVLVVDPQATK